MFYRLLSCVAFLAWRLFATNSDLKCQDGHPHYLECAQLSTLYVAHFRFSSAPPNVKERRRRFQQRRSPQTQKQTRSSLFIQLIVLFVNIFIKLNHSLRIRPDFVGNAGGVQANSLFITQRHHWIDLRGATGGNPGGEQRNCCE